MTSFKEVSTDGDDHHESAMRLRISGVNKIVILDEATSSLTHSMETRLSCALAEHFRSSTVITITHRGRRRNLIIPPLISFHLSPLVDIQN